MSTDKQGLKKHTTNINEIARQRLGITRDEYALCQFVQYRSADPRGKKSGWCGDKKDDLAEFIGITRPGLYKMLDRMSLVGLLEIDPSTGFCRVTSTWIDTEQNRKLSLQSGVNLVYKDCKLSLQNSVNLVTHNIEEKEIEKEQQEQQLEKAADSEAIFLSSTTGAGGVTIVESFNLAEKKEKDTPSSAAPLEKEKVHTLPHRPGPSVVPRWDAFDIDKEAELMKSDYRVFEKYAKDLGIDPDSAKRLMPAAVDEFIADQKAATYNYQNTRQIRTHFFNWILTAPKAKAAAKATAQQRFAPAPTPSAIPKNLQGLIGK